MTSSALHVGLVGPLQRSEPGCERGPQERLARLLEVDGFSTMVTSYRGNRWARLADILHSVATWRPTPDVLVVSAFSYRAFLPGALAQAVAGIRGIPVVLVLHGGELPRFVEQYPRLAGGWCRRAARLVAPSQYMAREFARLGLEADVIPNVIEVSRYEYRRRDRVRPKLLWLRTFHPIYGPAMALEVLRLVQRRVPDASLVMGGRDEGEERATKVRAAEMGLRNITFPGFLDHQQKVEYFRRSDVFLNTNLIDNMPVTCVEAAASGLPIVSTNAGGIPDLLTDSRTALLAEPNPESLADRVLQLLGDSDLAGRLSLAGRELAEGFDWANVGPRWSALIDSLRGDRA